MLETKRRLDDQQLIAAYRRGDDAAFGQMFARYEGPLLRYARKILGRSPEHAEDVVQEAMLRASRALRRDDRHIELKPWLYRLTRNCALDELARVRTDSVALDDADDRGVLRAADAGEPDVAVERRANVRDLLSDMAALPAQQRHALLRREVDGISHSALADELGVSEQATKNLVHRARTNLIKHREAVRRTASRCAASCSRPTTRGAARRRTSTATSRAARTAARFAPASRTRAAPRRCSCRRRCCWWPCVLSGKVAKGGALPAGTAIVRGNVRFASADPKAATVRLDCPPGLRVADLLSARGVSADTGATGWVRANILR